MSKRHDNTNRSSEFICLRCLSKNQVGDKMRRQNMRKRPCKKLVLSMYKVANEN